MYISLLSLPSLPLSLSLDCLHLKILDPQESRKPNRFLEKIAKQTYANHVRFTYMYKPLSF